MVKQTRRRRTSRRSMRGGAGVIVRATWSPPFRRQDDVPAGLGAALIRHLKTNGIKNAGNLEASPYLTVWSGNFGAPGSELPSPPPSLPDFSTTLNGKEYTATLKVEPHESKKAGGKRKTRGRRRA